MLLKRIASAIVGVPLLLFMVYRGGGILVLGVALVLILSRWEFHRIIVKQDLRPAPVVALLAGLFLLGAAYLNNKEWTELALTFPVAGALLWAIVFFPRLNSAGIGATILASYYPGWLLAHLILLRENSELGLPLAYLVFILTWASDTGAYFAGRWLGRHRLYPAISPKKTVEGALGALVVSVLAALIFGSFVPELDTGHLLVLGLVAPVVGHLGDFAESALKRLADVKDSGAFIPGHGGFLDRFDSLLFTAPAFYYYARFFIG